MGFAEGVGRANLPGSGGQTTLRGSVAPKGDAYRRKQPETKTIRDVQTMKQISRNSHLSSRNCHMPCLQNGDWNSLELEPRVSFLGILYGGSMMKSSAAGSVSCIFV